MKRVYKILCGIAFTVVAISAGILCYFFPIFKPFPKLTGPYAVGTITTTVETKNDREIIVTWYYPSNAEKNNTLYSSQPAIWRAYKEREKRDSWLPGFVWNQLLDGIKSYAIPDAPVNTGEKYPVIIFSHGIGAFSTYATYLEELASWGYIVVAVTHPGSTPVSVYPDERIVEIDPEFQKAITHNDRVGIYEYRTKAHYQWLDDLKKVLDSLEKYNNDPEFILYNALDVARIGALGHSHGGWAVTDLCMHDARVKAGINMDGYTKTVPLSEFSKPFMVLLNQAWTNQKDIDEIYKNVGNDAIKLAIPDAGHNAFSDYILLKWPLTRFFNVVTKDQSGVRKAIGDTLRIFFDWYVKNDLRIRSENHDSKDLVLINGTSSVGKSAIIRELQKDCGAQCRSIKLDDFFEYYQIKHAVFDLGEYLKKEGNEHLIFSSFYIYCRQLADSGYITYVDTVLLENEYEKYIPLLGKAHKVLIYCPLDIAVERVIERNKSGNPLEKRGVNQPVGQFTGIYKLQETVDEKTVDTIAPQRMLFVLDEAINELKELKVPQKEREQLRFDFIKQFKLDTLKEITIATKRPWDLVVNTGVNSPADAACMISKYLEKKGVS